MPAAPTKVPDEQAVPDAELLSALARGEARAFDRIYARYRVRIYGFLCRLCGRRDVADDLFQETFLQLARHARRLSPDTDLAAFLFTVARNRYRNHRRKSLFRMGRLWELFTGSSPGTPLSPLQATEAQHTAHGIEAALLKLSDPLREALLLVAVEGLSADAAAQILKISPAALRQRLSRGRAELQKLLGEADGV
jgi:RNA polymerase sigma-70 factor (ECF subfamily)